jgi:hypothetical protein
VNLSSFVLPPWVSIAWKALPWAGCLGLSVALALNIAGHRVERANWERDGAKAEASSAVTQAANEARKAGAVETHETRTIQMQPIIVNSGKAVDAYTKTPAGMAPCLSLERVQQILATRADLFAIAAASSPGPVPTRTAQPDAAQQR